MRFVKTFALAGSAVILLATGLATGAIAHQAQPAPQPQPRPRPQILPDPAASPLPATQALFDDYIRSDKMPGIVGAFGVGDSPTVFVAAGRIADGATAPAAGPDSLWRVYSMTKPVTAMAAMILIEDGKLKLDQPISDFFPGFKNMKVLLHPDTSLESRPATRPITVRNLLTHTAGLGYTIVTQGPLLKEYERLGITPGAINAAVEAQARSARPKTLAEFAERVATLPLIADPGTEWSYSIGLDVMGAVIEKASGMPFDTFVQTRIFDPLKMNSSYWTVPASEVGRFATNYVIMGDARTPFDPAATSVYLQKPSFPYGLQDGGALDGVRIMKPETAALAMSNLLPKGVTFEGIGGGTGGTAAAVPMGFGAGGSVYLADKPGGASKGTYGWGGAAGTVAWVDPVRHARGTIMVNYFPADKWPLREEVPAALVKDFARFQ